MQYTFLALALAALAVAVPQKGPGAPGAGGPPGPLCPSIDTPLCCQLDLDEVVDSTCSAPTGNTPKNIDAFKANCAADGLTAECCTLPVDGDALLCSAP